MMINYFQPIAAPGAVGREFGSPMSDLLEDGLISSDTFDAYFNDTLPEAQTAALTAFNAGQFDGQRPKFAHLLAVTFEFKSGAALTVEPEAITNLKMIEPEQIQPDCYQIMGFSCTFKPESPEIAEKFQNQRDLTFIHLKFPRGLVPCRLVWSPLADTTTNPNQNVVVLDDTVFIFAQAVHTFNLTELVKAAYQPEYLQIMAKTYQDRFDQDLTKITASLVRQLDELSKAKAASMAGHEYILLMDYAPEATSDLNDNPWDPVLLDQVTGEKYGGINLESYPALLAMPVRCDNIKDFWEGFAWLLWEISWFGIDTQERDQKIQEFTDSLTASEAESEAFHAATAKMKRFIDWYVHQHIADPTLPDFVATYWPLTAGRREKFDDGTPDGWMMTVTEQDPKLLQNFMAHYGSEFDTFE
ncbi:MAG: hypothetical protein LKF36_03535 [Lactobacillus sp.]|jgi:hypothetical protein|nr:hypothetical protein [Lactobacillus sp.]